MRYLNLIDTGMNKDEVSKLVFRYLIFIHEISGCLSQLKQAKLAFSAATYSSFCYDNTRSKSVRHLCVDISGK